MGWISIQDNLPEINERVLVIDNKWEEPYIRTMIYEGLQILDNKPIWVEFFDGYEVGNSDEVQTTGQLEVFYRSTAINKWMPLPEKD